MIPEVSHLEDQPADQKTASGDTGQLWHQGQEW